MMLVRKKYLTVKEGTFDQHESSGDDDGGACDSLVPEVSTTMVVPAIAWYPRSRGFVAPPFLEERIDGK